MLLTENQQHNNIQFNLTSYKGHQQISHTTTYNTSIQHNTAANQNLDVHNNLVIYMLFITSIWAVQEDCKLINKLIRSYNQFVQQIGHHEAVMGAQ